MIYINNKTTTTTKRKKHRNPSVLQRRSDMRACVAICLCRRGWTNEEILELMDESYDFNIMCKAENTSPFVEMQKLTGLNKI